MLPVLLLRLLTRLRIILPLRPLYMLRLALAQTLTLDLTVLRRVVGIVVRSVAARERAAAAVEG